MNVTIRTATVNDVASLARLNADVQRRHAEAMPSIFKQPSAELLPTVMFSEPLSDPNSIFFVAENGEDAVGYLWAEISQRSETQLTYARDSIMIHHISVQPAYQRQGVGAQLIAAVKDLARQEQIATVKLDTWSFNTDAQAFFARQGFTIYNYRLWTEVAL